MNNPHPLKSHQVIDWLMYRSYEHNRDRSPDIEPERWRKLYLYAAEYEKIYQERKSQCLIEIKLKSLQHY